MKHTNYSYEADALPFDVSKIPGGKEIEQDLDCILEQKLSPRTGVPYKTGDGTLVSDNNRGFEVGVTYCETLVNTNTEHLDSYLHA